MDGTIYFLLRIYSVTPKLRNLLFETLYKNRYLYRFASTVPFAGQWRVWQRLVLTRIHGHDVLELGCGLGDLMADMLEAGYICRAVEHSPQMVAAARHTLQRRKLGMASWIIQGTAQQLPFPDNMFDTVVSTFPSDYIYDPNTLTEASRVLRPGGRIIIIEGSNLLPVGYLQPLLVLIQMLVYGRESGSFFQRRQHNKGRTTDSAHEEFTTEEVSEAEFGTHIPLEQAGFRRRSQKVSSQRWEVYITIGERQTITSQNSPPYL
jgi:ubiquinone/menaquinone biosynthesis C-methylase UbiE